MQNLSPLDGRKVCVVFVKDVPGRADKAQIQCYHGRADISENKLAVIDSDGAKFVVPSSALNNILPSDGTALLRDAEYFVMVKLHPDIGFIGEETECLDVDARNLT